MTRRRVLVVDDEADTRTAIGELLTTFGYVPAEADPWTWHASGPFDKVTGKGQGTAGQFFSGVPADLAIGLGDATDVIGLDQDGFQTSGNWRSNLAFVETTGNPVDLTISRIDSNGTVLGSISQHLDGREVYQINYALTAIVNTTGTNQRIRVAVTGGSGRVITNASRVDNLTGDPATIEMLGEAHLRIKEWAEAQGQFERLLIMFQRLLGMAGLEQGHRQAGMAGEHARFITTFLTFCERALQHANGYIVLRLW